MNTYHQLRAFLIVARIGNLTDAARQTNATQPTVSLQLRALRRFLRGPLAERTSAGFRLRPAGEKLRRSAEQTLVGLRHGWRLPTAIRYVRPRRGIVPEAFRRS